MNTESIREYCLSKREVTEDCPFGDDNVIFKVFDKMFILLSLDKPWVNLKCDPEKAIELREKYLDIVTPGYHMNKALWNTVLFEEVSDKLLKEWIDESYWLVVEKLPKKLQQLLNE